MLSDLTPAQRTLAEYMSELSEEFFCAGWLVDLEYALWDAVRNGRGQYGWQYLDATQISRLRELSHQCGGWIVFDDAQERKWFPLRDWELRFVDWEKRGRPEDG
jgi:hypothetical protein